MKVMKNLIVSTALFVGLILSYSVGNAQTAAPQKSKEDGAVKSCCLKGDTKRTALAATYAAQKPAIAECPAKGTPECPLAKDCPLKGTSDCPLVNSESSATNAAKKPVVKEKMNADVPACCKKRT